MPEDYEPTPPSPRTPPPSSPIPPETPPFVPASPEPIQVDRSSLVSKSSTALPALRIPRIPRSQPLLRRLLADAHVFEPRLEEARQAFRRHHLAAQREQEIRRKTITIDQGKSQRIQKQIRHQARRRSHTHHKINKPVFCKSCNKVLLSEAHYGIHENTTAQKNKTLLTPKICKACDNQKFFSKQDRDRHTNGLRHRSNYRK